MMSQAAEWNLADPLMTSQRSGTAAVCSLTVMTHMSTPLSGQSGGEAVEQWREQSRRGGQGAEPAEDERPPGSDNTEQRFIQLAGIDQIPLILLTTCSQTHTDTDGQRCCRGGA